MYGFLRVAAAVPQVRVADCDFNTVAVLDMADKAREAGVRVVVFPEMCLTAYTCADLFHSRTLLDGVDTSVRHICEWTASHPGILLFVGAPVEWGNTLYNCAIAIADGSVLAAFPKTYIPNYNEFYEKRWWQSGCGVNAEVTIAGQAVRLSTRQLVEYFGARIYAEICEDVWVPCPPSCDAVKAGAQIIVNLSASDDLIGKYTYLRSLLSQQSARCMCAYLYSSAGFGESSTDLVFDGKAFVYENGTCLASIPRWQRRSDMAVADIDIEMLMRDRIHVGTSFGNTDVEYRLVSTLFAQNDSTISPDELLRSVSATPFVSADDEHISRRAEEIINIQCAGLAKRLHATGCRNLVVGISGGLDSTLALLVAVRTFDMLELDRLGIIGVTMPGFGTTGRTYGNAMSMMRGLGVSIREVGIASAVHQHFADIGHDEAVHDITYENSQARERTQILMDIANQVGGMVLGTGDLSELALGWATYNGDHMSMYGVNASVPKTLVRYLVRWFADTVVSDAVRSCLLDIIDTPISPELIPADDHGNITQITEDLVGPYELHDFFLYYTLRYGFTPSKIYFLARKAFVGMFSDEVIKKWIKVFFRRFFNQQFKRSCLPDGPKVGSVCLSPRGDWRMPSDATSTLWLTECEKL